MKDFSLTPEEFENLFSLDSDGYEKKAPSWIEHVQEAEIPCNVTDMLEQLRSNERTTVRLERALRSAGVPVPQDIPYLEAKENVEQISKRMQSVTDANEFEKLSLELERYSAALVATDEYQEELLRQEQAWEEKHQDANEEALARVRRHIPTNVRLLSEGDLQDKCGLPKAVARKLKRTNILELLRMAPSDIMKVHPSLLDQYKTTGLVLTERQALHAHLRSVGRHWAKLKDPSSERKLAWFNMLKSKFQEMTNSWDRHVDVYGNPSTCHKCSMLGNQCPFKANSVIDYSGDYRFPVGPEYEIRDVTVATETPLPESPKKERPKPSFLSELSSAQPKTDLVSEIAAGSKSKKTPSLPSSPPIVQKKKNKVQTKGSGMPSVTEIFAQKDKILRPTPPQSQPTPPVVVMSPRTPVQQKCARPPLAPSIKEPGAPLSPMYKSVRFSPKLEQQPKSAEEQRQLHIEEHYSDQPKARLVEARESYSSIFNALDLIESSLKDWIGRMLAAGNADLTEEEKSKQTSDFLQVAVSVKTVMDNLFDRIKWNTRSVPECEISEDLCKLTKVLCNFVVGRMKEMSLKSKAVKKQLKEVMEILDKVHERNIRSLQKLGATAARPTRKVCNISEIAKQVMKEKRKKKRGDKKKRSIDPEACIPLVQSSVKSANDCQSPGVKRENVPSDCRSSELTSEARREEKPPVAICKAATVSPKLSSCSFDVFQTNLTWQLARQLADSQRTNQRLEKAIKNAGLSVPDETIPYKVAEAKIKELTETMNTINFGDADYFRLEQEMEKYTAALLSSDEYKKELERREEEWENENRDANCQALRRIRAHMPVEVRNLSEKQLTEMTTPNGKAIPKEMARKFKRSSVLQLLRLSPLDIEQLHYATLESLSLSGLFIVERRAVYEHLRSVGIRWYKNQSDERKLMWYNQMKMKFKQELQKMQGAPFSAGTSIDYAGDLGFPQGDTYMKMEVAKEEFYNLAEKAKEESSQAVQRGMDYWKTTIKA